MITKELIEEFPGFGDAISEIEESNRKTKDIEREIEFREEQ